MKFYESGDNRKPVIFLFPGTCCLYSSFDHVLDGLHSYFYTVTVSYDGFDPNVAKIQSSMVVPFMYKMVHTGTLPKFMQKKLDKTDGGKKELYNGFLNMFGIGKGGSPWITKQSIYNQFYSDLVTKVQHGIDVPGTTIHVFYATKMGEKYEKRYCTYFKNPDIRKHNMQHEELFCCHSAEWVEEVRKAVELPDEI